MLYDLLCTRGTTGQFWLSAFASLPFVYLHHVRLAVFQSPNVLRCMLDTVDARLAQAINAT